MGPGSPGRAAIVVQIRLGSTRLKRKALLPLGGMTLADQVLARLSRAGLELRILATDEASAEALAPIARRQGFELLIGPAEDVLARYCLAIRRFGLERLIRATGDNPLVAHELIGPLLDDPAAARADYAAYAGLPLGMGVESVSAEALLEAEAQAQAPAEREHVCPYLYGHPERFALSKPEAPEEFLLPEARLTVDTREDYEAMLRIYGALYTGSPIPSRSVLQHLRSPEPRP